MRRLSGPWILVLVALASLCLGSGCAGIHDQSAGYDQIRQRADTEQAELDAVSAETDMERESARRRFDRARDAERD